MEVIGMLDSRGVDVMLWSLCEETTKLIARVCVCVPRMGGILGAELLVRSFPDPR